MPTDPKIVTLAELAPRIAALRADGRRVVQCHGVFDLLHVGHIRYLQRARELADVLVVTVTPDRWVNKGPHRPAFTEKLRLEALASLACVDFVALNEWPTASETIELLRPTLYAKGAEFRDNRTPEILREEAAAAAAGTEIAFIEDLTSSSSQLLNRYMSPFTDEVDRWLFEFAQRHPMSELNACLDGFRGVRPLVVGELIIDEYVACNTLGRSSKAPIVAMQYAGCERYAGGTAAIANHLAGFCEQVDLVCQIGGAQPEEDWVRAHLKPNVNPLFVVRADAPTIIKRRYRESYFSQPIFEVYTMNDAPPGPADDAALGACLRSALPGHDLVLVADYGHGMLSRGAIDILTHSPVFLAVNAQMNAGNVGFHTIGKYYRADYACLAEQEVRLECRDSLGEVPGLAQRLARQLGTKVFSATRGGRGCVCVGADQSLLEAPALAASVVDRVGAGDAFLAMTSLCALHGLPLDVLAFLGNVAGAEAAATIGNKDTLDSLRLSRHVQSLLK